MSIQEATHLIRNYVLGFRVGDTVRRNSDGAIGIIFSIGTSPFFAEEIHGINRAYVLFGTVGVDSSADYLLSTEMTFVSEKAVA